MGFDPLRRRHVFERNLQWNFDDRTLAFMAKFPVSNFSWCTSNAIEVGGFTAGSARIGALHTSQQWRKSDGNFVKNNNCSIPVRQEKRASFHP
jgi:hypothetical protein